MKRGRNSLYTFVILSALLATADARAQTVEGNGTRYELRLPASKAEIYAAALAAVTDSSFTADEASMDGGIIRTQWRRPTDVARGLGATVRASLRHPIRLQLLLIPISADSTRVTVTGERNMEDIRRTMRISDLDRAEWAVLRGIGDAIAAAMRKEQTP